MQYGTKVSGTLKPRYIETADLSSPGEVYQIDVQTQGIQDENGAITQALALESQYHDLRVLYVETNTQTNTVTIQFTDTGPGQFSFTGLLAAIPALFILAGIIIVGYLLWQLYQTQGTWFWALAFVGGAAAFFLLLAGPLSTWTKGLQPVYKPKQKEPVPTASVRYREEQVNIRTRIRDLDKQIDRVNDDIKSMKKSLESLPKGKSKAKDQAQSVLRSNVEGLEKQARELEAEKNKLKALQD